MSGKSSSAQPQASEAVADRPATVLTTDHGEDSLVEMPADRLVWCVALTGHLCCKSQSVCQ